MHISRPALGAALFLAASPAAAMTAAPPDDIAKWDLVCFCSTESFTPHALVLADDNGRLLYYARDGATKDELAAKGVRVTASALIALQDWQLLKKTGKTYTTLMPVLGPDKIARVRAIVGKEAEQVAAQSRGDVRAITGALAAEHMEDHGYAVVFSYVLDGMMWDRLRARSAFPSQELSVEHPHWNGSFWAVYPKREGVPGTNGMSEGHVGFDLTWTPATLDGLGALQASAEASAFLKALDRGEKPKEDIPSSAGAWHLMDASGKLRVPVVNDRTGDPIHDAGYRIAERIADRLLEPKSLAAIRAVVPAHQSEEIVIAAHEIIWDIIDRMTRDGLVHEPPVLKPGAQITPDALLPLVTIVKGGG